MTDLLELAGYETSSYSGRGMYRTYYTWNNGISRAFFSADSYRVAIETAYALMEDGYDKIWITHNGVTVYTATRGTAGIYTVCNV